MELVTLETAGFMPAMHAMRSPKNSWAKNDSEVIWNDEGRHTWILGENDIDLAHRLITGGPVHSKFLRSIMVWVEITAPLYWWSEFDTYKVGVVRNSCSTMHKLVSIIKVLDEQGSFNDWKEGKEIPKQIYSLFEVDEESEEASFASLAIKKMIAISKDETMTDTEKLKKMKKLLPDSYLQRSTVCLSYQNIRSMLTWRSDHRLPEWNTHFVNWAHTLPLAENLLFYNLGGGKA